MYALQGMDRYQKEVIQMSTYKEWNKCSVPLRQNQSPIPAARVWLEIWIRVLHSGSQVQFIFYHSKYFASRTLHCSLFLEWQPCHSPVMEFCSSRAIYPWFFKCSLWDRLVFLSPISHIFKIELGMPSFKIYYIWVELFFFAKFVNNPH